MNIIDIIIIIPLVYFAYKGFVKGLIYEVASIVALVLGIYISLKFSYLTEELITKNFSFETSYIGLISFVITFIVTVLGVHFIANFINKIVDMVALSTLNKLGGALFGSLKVIIIFAVIISICKNLVNFTDIEVLNKSELFDKLNFVSNLLFEKIQYLITNI